MQKREFDDIMANLKTTIAGYDFFVDFPKAYRNVDDVSIPLNLMNSLIGRADDFDSAFISLIHKYPEVLKAIPILLAVRAGDTNYKMSVLDENDLKTFNFLKLTNTDDECLRFMDKTGLKELLTGGHVKNLVDYVTGVEVGLDSNARKNRGGKLMEQRVEDYLESFGITPMVQATKHAIVQKYGYPELLSLNLKEGKSQADKRFDFAFKYKGEVFLVETNFYSSSGSKLNEVARSYEKLADDINKLPHYKFMWITDGVGWRQAKANLHESYSHQALIMTIKDMENRNLLDMIDEYTKAGDDKK